VAPRRTSPTHAVTRVVEPPGGRAGRIAAALLPSGRALLVALGLVLAGAGLYAGARSTSVFSVRTIAVRGASPETAGHVRAALAQVDGRSLLALDQADLRRAVERVPAVAHAELDRAFPHTLVVFVREERPAAVLRRGAESWLVAESGRVLDLTVRGSRPGLARIWVSKRTPVALGEQLGDPRAAAAVGAVAHIPVGFPDRVRDVRTGADELTFGLASGIDLRLGDTREIELKLAIAKRILPRLRPDRNAPEHYLDVSVVERPVAGGTLKSEVEVEG
jgi:cell division protein FtsQ